MNSIKAMSMIGKYVQGPNAINGLAEYTEIYGHKAYILIDVFFYEELKSSLIQMFENRKMECAVVLFCGEITNEKVQGYLEQVLEGGYGVVIGIGGGKTMDSAKAVAEYANIRCIIVPTSAASDAPCSSLSIIYDIKENTREMLRCRKNPDMVLVDTAIIANAPKRFIVAGIGDAMSTYFEMVANEKAHAFNWVVGGYFRTRCSVAIAELCKNLLLEYGEQAIRDIENHMGSEAVEHVIEANILLSGIGFENTGCAAAHSFSAGLSALEECKSLLHGEKVAFGVLCHMVLEDYDEEEILQMSCFFRKIGLPVTLEDLGCTRPKEEAARMVAHKSLDNAFWDHEPFEVSEAMIFDAIIKTDRVCGNVRS